MIESVVEKKSTDKKSTIALWGARLAVFVVFFGNVQCALSFLFFPQNYAHGFELSGVAGIAAIQGIGVAFLMWNATYPLVIVNPLRYRILYVVVLVQQLIGLLGESYILSTIDVSHLLLRESIVRFIVFDACGLVVMALAFVALLAITKRGS
ncbi:MAG: hypothetical protein FWG24_03690 [Eggerthellaceae bacterium]|nr:hypothetical protein [Eggerthellaceae bacterium]